ncbi:hypothetical protein CON71_23775 [Bacillus thuringiensis]|uniref:Tn3 transposase DDE domain-containing protein n=1 Tax=Bacillus thuringiensis TaxID=1428 RepID=A0A9X6TJV0_BACTU|nr:hypothetical protein CON71_23775 [Bacillus thuringiensis]
MIYNGLNYNCILKTGLYIFNFATDPFNHLVANCLIFYNVFALTQVLHAYRQDGNELDEEVLSELSTYITAHVNRFGKYGIYPNRQPPDLQFDMPIYQVAY